MRARLFAACALSLLVAACGSGSNSIDVTSPSALKCEVTASNAMTGAVPFGGVTSTVTVTTTRDCTWTATANAAWVTLSPASGQGSGSIEYRVGANGDPGQRRATIEVNNTQLPIVQDPAPCRYSVSPTSTAVSAAGGALTITVDTVTGCSWTAASDASWIGITANATGNKAATVTATVAPNTGPLRRGTITIGGQAVSVEQAAYSTSDPTPPTPCSFAIAPTSQNVTADAGSGTITVTASTGCTWTAASNTSWITITGGASGSGNGAVAFSVAANGGGARSGSITVAGKTATISQSAAPCTYSLGSSSQTVPPEGGTGSVSVNAGSACAWTATSAAGWITITSGASGTGNGNVQFSAAPNTGTTARTGMLTIAGRTFSVTQAAPPPPCTFSISPTTQSVSDTGGPVTVAVTASAGSCAWTASSNVGWITVTNGASGTGSGSVTIAIAANTGAARSGTVSIAGQTLTINQAAPAPCTFSIAPTSQNLPDAAGSGSVAVTASATTCGWTAVSNAAWITITSGASGTGNGTVAFSVAANTGAARSGTLTIGGQTFTINQSAAPPPPCTFSIAPPSQNLPDTAGSGSVAVTASAPTCAWSAVSNAAWLTIAGGATGTGNGTVAFNVAANTGAARSGTLTIAGQTFTVNQAAPPPPPVCTYSVAPPSQTVPGAGASASITITASDPSCTWTAASTVDWILITSPASGTGSGAIAFSVAPNSGGARTGTLTVAGQTATVNQLQP